MRAPLSLRASNPLATDMINTVQTLYLLGKINTKAQIDQAGRRYMALLYQRIDVPGLRVLLEHGVHVNHVQEIDLDRVARQDGGGYVSRVWASLGYTPEAINHKVVHDFPGMHTVARTTLEHARVYPRQWSQSIEQATTTVLLGLTPGNIAHIALDDENGVRRILMYGIEGEEFLLFDPVLGEYACRSEDLESRISNIQLCSSLPF